MVLRGQDTESGLVSEKDTPWVVRLRPDTPVLVDTLSLHTHDATLRRLGEEPPLT